TAVDQRLGGFPIGQFPNQSQGAFALNGNIKISAVSGPTLVSTTVYAAVASPNRQLRAIYKTTTGGQSWAATASPGNYMASQGDYANAIYAVNAQTVYVGGFESNAATHLGQFFVSVNGGGNWTDISVGSPSSGPHTAYHAITVDGAGRVYAGTDGGLWRR